MNLKQREWLANGFKDLGNLAAAIMLFGWFMAATRPPLWLPVSAGAFWLICYSLGFFLLKGKE